MKSGVQVKIVIFCFLAFISDGGGKTVLATTTETPTGTVENTGKEQCPVTKRSSDCLEFERYRSYNGRCNNLKNPEQGAAEDVQQRILSAEYDDPSISSPRSKNKFGTDLPSPRTVSQKVHTDMAKLDSKFTVMLMQWGQFIDHDFNLTPHIEDNKQCEDCSKDVNSGTCFPIKIKSGDSFFKEPNDSKCFSFTRSKPSSGANRNQTNVLTSYLDGSMVYGSNESFINELREDNSHRMKVLIHPDSNRGLLPNKCDKSECSSVLGYCFLAGDIRVNEQPGLTTMHTIFVREHNRIADSLASINPHWEVNRVFEETRRIIGAQIQHITYNEFLPHVLGPNRLNKFEVNLQTSGYYSGYDESCSAAPFNEFSTAAFRFGHSMIPPNFAAISEEAITDASLIRQLPLRNHFFNPDLLVEPNTMDDLLRGLTMVPMQPVDRFVTEELTNHLFENRTVPKSGMDLPSLNIQRGRDHGLPGYNKYREVCNLQKAKEFSDLKNEMTDATIAKLKEVYSHPDDIDLYTGLLSETPQTEALTGPTLACIIGRQFKHLRQCDRYWYETSDPKIRFTQEQLKELRSSNLAALICKNMDRNSKFSRTPMKQVDVKELVDCDKDIQSIDLEAWREAEGCSSLDYVSLTKFNQHEKQYQELIKNISISANKLNEVRDECMNYNFLTDKTRLSSNEETPWLCDQDAASNRSPGWRGAGLWYRFTGAAGSYMAETPPGVKHCKTNNPGWISTPLPTEPNQSFNATFCFQSSDDNTCAKFVHGKVTNCKSYFVYQLPDTLACSMRYCSTYLPYAELPSECRAGKYNILDEEDRNRYKGKELNNIVDREVQSGTFVQSKRWVGEGWYRIVQPAGSMIPESKPDSQRCSTFATGYIKDPPSTQIGKTNDVKICFHWLKNDCYNSVQAKITNCGSYNVYFLQEVPGGYYRYCAA